MNILDTIVAYKREEVAAAKRAVPESDLRQRTLFARPTLSLVDSLRDGSKSGIIAEFKRRSPSKGVINDRSSAAEVAAGYAAGGASGLSVLTDGPSFGGSLEDLLAARAADIPILRKEFIVEGYQVTEARAHGADVILLIAAVLTPGQVTEFAGQARALGMQVILELHDETELGHVSDAVDIVGVNNRNLKTFEVDLQQSARLAPQIKDKLLISESGIYTVDDIMYLQTLGFEGFLIGEAFMRERDPGAAFAQFAAELKNAKG